MHRVLPKFMHWNKHKGDKKRLNHKDKTSASDTNHWIQNVADLTEQNRKETENKEIASTQQQWVTLERWLVVKHKS